DASFPLYQRLFLFELWCKQHLNNGVRACPTRGCAASAFLIPTKPSVQCLFCSQVYCFPCETQHEPSKDTCKNYTRWLKDNKESESKFQDILLKGKVKLCPGCRSCIFRDEGCQVIVCTICKYEFFFDTLEPCRGQDHRRDAIANIVKL